MLTTKELMLIQDNIHMGQSMINFLTACSNNVNDSQLKNLCQTMINDHKNDIQTLSSHITNQNIQ